MTKITLVEGDMLQQHDLDLIVNAANTHLQHGAGIAGAIARAGGPEIQRQSNLRRPIPTGSAVATTAGALPFAAVIHAVGPVWGGGKYDEERLLHLAVRSALTVADDFGRVYGKTVKVGMPAISCGIFGYPPIDGARTIVAGIRSVTRPTIEEVRICVLGDEHYDAFKRLEHVQAI